jgi:hypothetical protein
MTLHKITEFYTEWFSVYPNITFISPPMEVMLRTLSPLKIDRPRPGLNPRTLGPVASTLTTRQTTEGDTLQD